MWTEECETSFMTLKDLLASPPILAYPNRTGLFVLDTDASESDLVLLYHRYKMAKKK